MPLPQPCPDIEALDLLVSVGELGSISAAAALHGVTQPAASMRLRTLERQLGVTLMERATSGARLTSAGKATAQSAISVVEDMRRLLSAAAALRTDQGSHLRLGASFTVAEYLLPRWLQALAAAAPMTKVALEMGNTTHVLELVIREAVDLGFIEGPRPPGRLHSKELVADELVIVVPKGHPWSRRRRVSVAELAATPLVLREVGSGTREVLTQALDGCGLGVTTAMELGSTTAIKSAVIDGAGPAVLSSLAVRDELDIGQLVAVACDEVSLRRTIRAVWSRSQTPVVAQLVAIAMAQDMRALISP